MMRWFTVVLSFLLANAFLTSRAHATADAGAIQPVLSRSLPDIPGLVLTSAVVSYEPRGTSHRHHHGGDVFAYVLSGAIRSQNSRTGATRIYRQGEAFFEPFPSDHLTSANESSTSAARLLVVFIAPRRATLTTFDDHP